ncbi:hypothetical protein E2C00_01425 [Streptomyces sp. WAC05374]|uniref:hypothetical protein n=1 Tax=Streptomyces sp. WAC05374 TaxID=2487420 RepID=UPI000F88382F|nr:hypothetical protein [Streptomyces sp. WAC05374]RST17546.1 hypothetical protein EF905_09070 [Streptomyces sp. WAC05374]TDF50202.1 hypothetical protein E2B92_01400 [Streptomyces sp. WAC05374]TDF57927.1 hypothetical protein E2C02_09190 [Streptomyces sp. WAC05374]TDF60456.1 hypothetical protein E2C00_01425 [Streptomyces sp. WAC05374]
MDTYTVEYTAPKTPPLRERKVKADDYAVKGEFVDFTTLDGTKVFSIRADAIVTIAKEAPSSLP